MIFIENADVYGFKPAVRGMRNPLNSWYKSDSSFEYYEESIGEADKELMEKLARGGSVHAKYRRMIIVTLDITAPLYWWKEFDTYKVGTVANSCSTMHTIHKRDLTLDDFSCERLFGDERYVLGEVIRCINANRVMFADEKDVEWKKKYWYQMIQLLPSSFNQKRTVLLNYEVLSAMYRDRRSHKLDEWRTFCNWIEKLPYASGIIFENKKGDSK